MTNLPNAVENLFSAAENYDCAASATTATRLQRDVEGETSDVTRHTEDVTAPEPISRAQVPTEKTNTTETRKGEQPDPETKALRTELRESQLYPRTDPLP